uniref:Uncharacterized protein n=1 Tax=Oncorhynchus tshawytscha TaxID=74940 RepID=A0AAZ3PXD1_ONCTS
HEKEAFHKQFSKLSPQSKVENYVDREFTLPSHLSPEISAVCIYLYKRGQVTEVRGYKGRLSLITQERERGNVSLKLERFRTSMSIHMSGHPCEAAAGGCSGAECHPCQLGGATQLDSFLPSNLPNTCLHCC